VLNYLAAPFGSREDLLLSYGAEGPDYTLDDQRQSGAHERGNPDANYLPFKYIAQRPSVLYLPDIPDYTKELTAAEKCFCDRNQRSNGRFVSPFRSTARRRGEPNLRRWQPRHHRRPAPVL